MESTYLKLEIRISATPGKSLPDQDDILHVLTEGLYDYAIGASAIIDQVHVTEIDGRSTDQDE